MHKPDFEKKVQQKMQELRFHPSDKVWKGVEAGISKEKRRRPLAVWLLIGTALLAGGYYLFTNSTSNKIAVNQSHQPGQSIAQKQKPGKSQEILIAKTQKEKIQSISIPGRADDPHEFEKKHSASSTRDRVSVSNPSVSHAEPETGNDKPLTVGISSIDGADASHETVSVERLVQAAEPLSVKINGQSEFEFHPATNDNGALPLLESNTNLPQTSIRKTNWSFGINVSAGRSDLDDQLFKTAAAAGMYYDPLASYGGIVSHKPSDIKPAASFSLGAYAAKSIGSKTRLAVGISYQYFSNTIQVGEKVDSVVVVNQNSLAMDRVNEYYKSANSGGGGSGSSNDYRNEYHYLSIPLTFQWQFYKRLSWENQLVYSHMIKTNALHFDGATGAYYENKDLFNKNQFLGSTAILFSLWKNKIQAGPQLQYAFTNLLQGGINNSRHIRSLNLKANIELWKN